MSDKREGRFVLKKITSFKKMQSETVQELPESDLCFQDERNIYQFKYIEPAEEKKKLITPGTHTLYHASGVTTLKETELRYKELLTSVQNTSDIMNEAQTFFRRLHIYDELNEPKKRSVLLYSDPGMGKTATIIHFCEEAIKEDPGTVVITWPTGELDADDVSNFLSKGSEYDPKCSRLILVIEDIGGGEREGNGGSRQVDSSLLDLLDGLEVTFKLPTFIIATTNYPQNLLSALADRPGRFDLLLELLPPSYEERVALTEFIAKRELTKEEKEALNGRQVNDFSIAHLKEVIIRSRLHDKSIPEVIEELIQHKRRFKEAFEKDVDGMGFNR